MTAVAGSARPRVAIVQRVVPHYRVAFFRELHAMLETRGVALNVVYGDARPGTQPVTVPLDEPWAIRICNRYWMVGGRELTWQPARRHLRDADLVVVEQSSRLLLNYLLLAGIGAGRARLAFWGHGQNFQACSDARARRHQRWKGLMTGRADWFFAYTERSLPPLRASGFPAERITVVNNAVDTRRLVAARERLTEVDLGKLRRELGLDGDMVALYCGAMYAGKKLAFLLQACDEIQRRVPKFHMLFVGDGPDRSLVESAADSRPWLHCLGPKFATDAVPYFALSKALLLPGQVGLAVVDALALGVPPFTTSLPDHGPEIAYLEHGVNGEITEPDPVRYAEAVAAYLDAPKRQRAYSNACAAAAKSLTIETMAERFADGISRCLRMSDC